jgi:hypothetical protein
MRHQRAERTKHIDLHYPFSSLIKNYPFFFIFRPLYSEGGGGGGGGGGHSLAFISQYNNRSNIIVRLNAHTCTYSCMNIIGKNQLLSQT